MLADNYDVSLDGVSYKIASMDDSYVISGEPLRPANAQVVQGTTGVFNLRPDLLRWRITSWAGGEGQFSFNGSPEYGDQYWKGVSIDGFSRYGVIRPGHHVLETRSSDASRLAVIGEDVYWLAASGASSVADFKWNGTTTVNTLDFLPGSNTRTAVVGSHDKLYYYQGGTIYSQVAGYAPVTQVTDLPTLTDPEKVTLIIMRDLIFLVSVDEDAPGVWQGQINAPSNSGVLIYELTPSDSLVGSLVTTTSNRVYVVQPDTDGSTAIVHEVIPDDASATGYGYVRATVPGVFPDAAWFHQGYLWISGPTSKDGYRQSPGTDPDGRVLFYLDFGQGTYGSISSVQKDGLPLSYSAAGGGAMGSRSHVACRAVTALGGGDTNRVLLYQIDQSTGGVQNLATSIFNEPDPAPNSQPLVRKGGMVWYNAGNLLIGWSETRPVRDSHFITSWFDYGLADKKTLTTLELTLRKKLTENWNIDVYYQVDDGGDEISDFTLYNTVALTPASPTSIDMLPTSGLTASNLLFSKVRFLVRFRYSAQTDPTSVGPELTSMEANARAVHSVHVRDMWLLLDDEHSMMGRRGSQQISNLEALGRAGAMFELKDGYQDRSPGVFTTHNVTMDTYRIFVERPGEGLAWVRLLEVV